MSTPQILTPVSFEAGDAARRVEELFRRSFDDTLLGDEATWPSYRTLANGTSATAICRFFSALA